MPLYSPSTKGQWLIRFDVALADGLEAGPLRMADVTVPAELEERIHDVLPKGLPPEIVCTLIAYYAANKPEATDWVVLPVARLWNHQFWTEISAADPWGDPGTARFRIRDLPVSGVGRISDLREKKNSRPSTAGTFL